MSARLGSAASGVILATLACAVMPPVATFAAPPASSQLPAPSAQVGRLEAAMARVSREPRSVDALLEAGGAASANGQDEAAIGFFTRAKQVAPTNPRVLAGMGSAQVRANDPVGALSTYEQAEHAGPLASATLGDRGLAYDLVGDNARAQRAYRQALVLAEDHEITRRLSLSQAIAGDIDSAETTLRPLLQAQDKAGWRTRAFIYAISGRTDEAVTVARTLLPGYLAEAITPYLRFMPRLTRAQQAAAANLGVFPQAAAIGRDDNRIARYAAAARSTALAQADDQLVPAGAPLGRRAASATMPTDLQAPRSRSRAELAAERATRAAPPEPPPASRIVSGVVAPGDIGAATPPAPSVLSGVHVPQLAAIAERGLSHAGEVASRTLTLPSAARPSLADAFGDIGVPDSPSTLRAGAVDVTRLAAMPGKKSEPAAQFVKPSPARTARSVRAAAPSQPSRIWVQLGIGRDHTAMVADWRRMLAQGGKTLKGRQPFVSENGARERMLTGPFETDAAARAFVQQLGYDGLAGPYVWVSPAGQVVDPLSTR